jgi:quinol monooxygenase YgiN
MKKDVITEFVKIETLQTTTDDQLISKAEIIIQFLQKQDGFIDTELLYDKKENTWIMIQHWASLEQMKASSANMFMDNATEAFRDAIEPKSISISVFPVLRTWSRGDTA